MKLKLVRPLAFLDIESTGANWKTDRLIDLAVIKVHPDDRRETRVFRVNPGMPIPRASTLIHGISDADVKDAPLFAQQAAAIAACFDGCDLAGYNLLRFDIPLLEEEFKRAGSAFDMNGRHVIDAQRIFHRREPRDLTAALAFYCGEILQGAHGALADTEATVRELEGEFERYPDLPADPAALAEYCNPLRADFADRDGKLVWDADGDAAINFGKFKGKKLREMAVAEKNYLEWMLRKNFARDVEELVLLALQGQPPMRPAAPPAAE